MIVRAALSLGLVWLLTPHHPDLGLPASEAISCSVSHVCDSPSALKRSAIFERLREVRNEMRVAKNDSAAIDSGVGNEGEAASQNAGRLPVSVAAAFVLLAARAASATR
jgi:hypothetical protein